MLKTKKPVFCLFALALILLCLIQAAALTPTDSFYVNDYVGVLNSYDMQEMTDRANRLCEGNGVQVVVIVVDNYIGDSIDAYATKVFNEWGIGQKGDNNGILLMVAVSDRDVCIRVGDGLDGQLPDSKTGRILDSYFVPYARENDFGTAVYETYTKLLSEGSRLDTSGRVYKDYSWVYPFLVFIAVIIILVITANLRYRYRCRHGFSGDRPHYPTYGRRRHIHTPPHPPDHTRGGSGRTSGGGVSRSFGSSPGRSSSSGSRPLSGSRSGSNRPSGGGGRSSGGGSSRKF